MKTAVLLYLYDTSLWPEFEQLLIPIKSHIKLFVGLCSDNLCQDNEAIISRISANFDASISIYPNKGVDIGPFLLQIDKLDKTEYPYFIKLHSKKSLWGLYRNISWRSLLVHSLIGSPTIFHNNIQLLNDNKSIGAIGNTGLLLDREKEGFNSQIIFDILHNNLKIPLSHISRYDFSFLAGSIFGARTSIFQDYFTSEIIKNLYAKMPEGIIIDNDGGKITHALERIFGYIIRLSNYQFANGYIDNKKTLICKSSGSKSSIIICYDDTCYLDSNILYAGKIFYINNKQLLINWKHSNKNGFWKKYIQIKKDLYYY